MKNGICAVLRLSFGLLLLVGCRKDSANSGIAETVAAADVTAEALSDNTPDPKYHRLLAGDRALLNIEATSVEKYLQSKQFSAESLLVAFQMTSNHDHLAMATAKHPNDPHVQFVMAMQSGVGPERVKWLARMKESAPENAFGYYLAAREAFRAANPQLALQEISTAERKSQFRDFTRESMQALEELYRADGRSLPEAKLAAVSGVLLPHLNEVRQLAKELSALQQRYTTAGDSVSANRIAANIVHLGKRLDEEGNVSILSQLIGLGIESQALAKLSPDAVPDFAGGRVDERLAQIKERMKLLRENGKYFDEWMKTAGGRDIVTYLDRVKQDGESMALAWLRSNADKR